MDNSIATLPVNNRKQRTAEVDALLAEHGTAKSAARKVRIPPLTRDDLTSDRGIDYVKNFGPKLQFKGKGFEADDLHKLCDFYNDWAHQLAPKLAFPAFIRKVDKICRGRVVKHYWNAACGRENEAVANGNLVQDDERNNVDNQGMAGPHSEDDDNGAVKPIRRLVETNASFGFDDSELSDKYQSDDLIPNDETTVVDDQVEDEDDEELELSIFAK